ncbi:hypothetical protein F5141DRAFT_975522, partial [Pisolithus sp. B1]
HPYWYVCIVHIFYVNVCHFGPNSTGHEIKQMNMLFVRWFGHCMNSPSGFTAHCLHCISFIEAGDPDAFGFVDPNVMLWSVHLIPSFTHSHTDQYLGPLFICPIMDDNEDWRYFHVNISANCTRFVDHDMFMRFRGGGVRHVISCNWDNFWQLDQPNFDVSKDE